jgi:GNAT superfamily N-acetyltransferase
MAKTRYGHFDARRVSNDLILSGEIRGGGSIDSETPELAMAVFKKYRRLGIGTGLLHRIADLAFKSRDYKQISLSVDKASHAVQMYKKFGFEMVKENEQDYIMALKRK